LGFGVLVQGLIGFAVLMGYAVSGVWLLIVRRWSTRALLVAVLASATLGSVWSVAVGSYQWATLGVERANAVYQSPRPVPPARQAADQELRAAEEGTSFLRLAAARVVRFVYLGRFTDLLGDWQRGVKGALLDSLGNADLTLFLIGLLAVRLGVFDQPAEHRRLLVAVVLVGAVWWSVDQWKLYETVWSTPSVIPVMQVPGSVQSWFGLFGHGGRYLALTYIAAITLLVAFSKAWEWRLAVVFGAAGRLALTNYIVQCAVLSVAFDNYGFGVTGLTPQFAATGAIILFATLAVFSRWWLARFRLGPAEWVLRSVTYARLQPVRRHRPVRWPPPGLTDGRPARFFLVCDVAPRHWMVPNRL